MKIFEKSVKSLAFLPRSTTSLVVNVIIFLISVFVHKYMWLGSQIPLQSIINAKTIVHNQKSICM